MMVGRDLDAEYYREARQKPPGTRSSWKPAGSAFKAPTAM